MKKTTLLTVAGCLLIINSFSQSVTRLVAGSPFDNVLRILDTANYTQITTKNLTSGLGVNGMFGLARRPSTGIYYTIFSAGGSRYLGSINLATGSITSIGNLNDNFSQLTINGNNTLLGITGNGAGVPNSVYRINPTNAAKTLINSVVPGNGQVICYNPVNNRVYHWTQSYSYILTSYDTLFTSAIGLPGSNSGEVMGAVYKTNNSFVSYDWDSNFMKVHGTGVTASPVAFFTQNMKALAYVTCSRTITASSASVCANGPISFTMSGSPGATYQWFKNNLLIPGATSATYATLGGGYFKCRINDGCGQDSLAPGKNIFVLTTPSVAVTGNSVACTGQTIQLVGSSGGTSQWYKNGVLIAGANTNSYVVSTPGLYNMIKTNLNGCADSAQVGMNVSIVALPTVSINGPNSTCVGSSIVLNASGASTYTWNNQATGGTITFTPGASTNYSVTGAVGGGACSATANVFVTVNPLPVVNASSSASLVCLNTSSVTLTSSGATTYTWQPGGNIGNSILVSPLVTTTYTVTGTDANGCKNVATVPIAVVNSPTITAVAVSTIFCANMSATLSASGALNYTWSIGGTGPLLVFTPTVSALVSVTGTDANGCSVTGTLQVGLANSPTVTTVPNSTLVCAGKPVTFIASGAATFSWSNGASGQSIVVSNTATSIYTVTGISTNGCRTSKSVTLTIDPCVGITTVNGTNVKVNLYPNPNNGQLMIESEERIKSVEVYDLTGKLVFVENVQQVNALQLNIESLSNSVYLFKVYHVSGKSTQTKITLDK